MSVWDNSRHRRRRWWWTHQTEPDVSVGGFTLQWWTHHTETDVNVGGLTLQKEMVVDTPDRDRCQCGTTHVTVVDTPRRARCQCGRTHVTVVDTPDRDRCQCGTTHVTGEGDSGGHSGERPGVLSHVCDVSLDRFRLSDHTRRQQGDVTSGQHRNVAAYRGDEEDADMGQNPEHVCYILRD